MLDLLRHPWHWSVVGILIGLTVPILYLIGNKPFGISSTFRHVCAAVIPSGIGYFKYNWKEQKWSLFFVSGIVIGGFIANTFLKNPDPMQIASSTQAQLAASGLTSFDGLEPSDIFSWQGLGTLRGFIMIVVGGFLVGFGTRYAGGCTSGHSITGISNLQPASLIATVFFMIGGFIMTWFILPFILHL